MDSIVPPILKKDSVKVLKSDSSLVFIDDFLDDMKFHSNEYALVFGYDLSRLIWNALDNSITGYKFRFGVNRLPWGIQAEYGFEKNLTESVHYQLEEKGDFFNIGIHRQNSWNSFGFGYQQVNYQRKNSRLLFYDKAWQKTFVKPIRDYDFTLHSLRFYNQIRAELFSGIYLSLGGSIDFIQNYTQAQNIPMFWIPGMTLEWSRAFDARLNFDYILSYHFKF